MGLRNWIQEYQIGNDLSRVRTSENPHLLEYKSDSFLPQGYSILEQAYEQKLLPEESVNYLIEKGVLRNNNQMEIVNGSEYYNFGGSNDQNQNNEVLLREIDRDIDQDGNVSFGPNDRLEFDSNGGIRVVNQQEINPRERDFQATVDVNDGANRFPWEQTTASASDLTAEIQNSAEFQDILKRNKARMPGYTKTDDLLEKIGELELVNNPGILEKFGGMIDAEVRGGANTNASFYYKRDPSVTGFKKPMSHADMAGRVAWGNTARDMLPKLAATGLIKLLA